MTWSTCSWSSSPATSPPKFLDQLQETLQRLRCALREAALDRRNRRVPQRCAAGTGHIAQGVQGLCADAARGQIDHALEGGVVGAARDQAKIGERVLDLRPLEEAQTPVNAIRHAGIQEGFFEDPRLRVGAVQHGYLAPRAAAIHPFADAVDHEVGFIALVERGVKFYAVAVRAAGPQVLAEAAGIVGDERVGGLENGAGGPVVLFQLVEHRAADSRGGIDSSSRRGRRASDRSIGRRRPPRTAGRRAPRAASATCTEWRWCPEIRRPARGGSASGSARSSAGLSRHIS